MGTHGGHKATSLSTEEDQIEWRSKEVSGEPVKKRQIWNWIEGGGYGPPPLDPPRFLKIVLTAATKRQCPNCLTMWNHIKQVTE